MLAIQCTFTFDRVCVYSVFVPVPLCVCGVCVYVCVCARVCVRAGGDEDMFPASHDDDLFEKEGTPFGKGGGGLFSGSGHGFDDEEGEAPQDGLEASIRSRTKSGGGGDIFGDDDEDDDNDWMTGSTKKSPTSKKKQSKKKKKKTASDGSGLFDDLEGGGESGSVFDDEPASPSPKEKKKKKVLTSQNDFDKWFTSLILSFRSQLEVWPCLGQTVLPS